MLKTEGVLHFTIPVKDLDRSEKFYTEILGLEKLRKTDHMVFMRASGTCFVLTLSENEINTFADGASGCFVADSLSLSGFMSVAIGFM